MGFFDNSCGSGMYDNRSEMYHILDMKKREILCDLETAKTRILTELSVVDKSTITRLREIIAEYNKTDFEVKLKLQHLENRINSFTTLEFADVLAKYETDISTMISGFNGKVDSVLESFATVRQEFDEVKTDLDLCKNEALTATSIAKGKNRARVFNTTSDMNYWLSSVASKGECQVGDNLYIIDVGVPDWWVAEVYETPDVNTGYYYKIAQLETQKVDLTPLQNDINALKGKVTDNMVLNIHGYIHVYYSNLFAIIIINIPSIYLEAGKNNYFFEGSQPIFHDHSLFGVTACILNGGWYPIEGVTGYFGIDEKGVFIRVSNTGTYNVEGSNLIPRNYYYG